MGLAGAAVVGVAFGMARYAYGLTLPGIEEDFDLSELLLGMIASGTFVGYLLGLVLAVPLANRRGLRAPTTVGGLCGAVGALLVTFAPSAAVLAVGAVLAGSAGGWVWATYSDIVRQAVDPARRPRTLAIITTGTAVGLVGLGALGVLAAQGAWRWVWAGIAVAAVLAALVNIRLAPRAARAEHSTGQHGAAALLRVLKLPAIYSFIYFAVIIVYFTYAAEIVAEGELPAEAVPALYAVIGVTGVAGVTAGALAQRLGSRAVAAWCLAAVAVALALLGWGQDSLAATAASAAVFGAAYMIGSAVLAVWTAQLVPDRASAAFTVCLVVGAVSSAAAPALAGMVIPALGLETLLIITGAISLVSGATLPWSRSARAEDAATHR
ncbi:MFS transporter [Demequina sp. SO4-13]|uniref:MFS transporter n=1 Tax=Demequina sp. SO4-13 TaxID=3401027 RepID=UPI003AF5243D